MVVALALGYGVGLASARYAVNEAALLGLLSAVLLLVRRRARTRKARAQLSSCRRQSGVHGPEQAEAPSSKARARTSGGVNRLSQPSSGDG
jgi:hypothetical protein